MRTLDVCVVCYNSEGTLAELFSSLALITASWSVRVLLHANSDPGRLREAIKRMPAPYAVEIVGDGSNIGFAAACNALARRSDADVLLLLNPDAAIRRWPDDLSVGERELIGPTIWTSLGAPQLSFGTDRDVKSEAAHRLLRRGVTAPVPDTRITTDFVSGAAILVNRESYLACGGLDENFFMYYEDIDLGRRWRDSGGTVVVEPAWEVTHIGGASARVEHLGALLRSQRSAEYFHGKWGHSRFAFRMVCIIESTLKNVLALMGSKRSQVEPHVQRALLTRLLGFKGGIRA